MHYLWPEITAKKIILALESRAGFDDWWMAIHESDRKEILHEIMDILGADINGK